MRRTFLVAFLSALLIPFSSALAQRSGGHSGGFSGGHSAGSFGHSFGGGFSSGSFGRSSGFAPRSFAIAPRFTSTAPARSFAPAYRVPYGGISSARRPSEPGRDRYRSPYRGYGVYSGFPYLANSWELLPWDLGYPDFTSYGDDAGSDVEQQSAVSLAPPDDSYRPDYGDPSYQGAPPEAGADPVAPEPQLTLIFNDGHRETIRNYVLTHNTVIVLDQAASGYQQRVPLASLNLSATQQEAQQAGLDFSPPA